MIITKNKDTIDLPAAISDLLGTVYISFDHTDLIPIKEHGSVSPVFIKFWRHPECREADIRCEDELDENILADYAEKRL